MATARLRWESRRDRSAVLKESSPSQEAGTLENVRHGFFELLFVLLRVSRQRVGTYAMPDSFLTGNRIYRHGACRQACVRPSWWRTRDRRWERLSWLRRLP